jgi:hypothetical protein
MWDIRAEWGGGRESRNSGKSNASGCPLSPRCDSKKTGMNNLSMVRNESYQAKQFKLSGFHGIADQTLERRMGPGNREAHDRAKRKSRFFTLPSRLM